MHSPNVMSFIIYSIHCLPQAACVCSVGSILFCCKAALVLDDSVLFILKYIQIVVFDKDTTYLHLIIGNKKMDVLLSN